MAWVSGWPMATGWVDPVARGEVPPKRLEARRQLGDDAPLSADPLVEPALARRVGHVRAAGQHGDRVRAGVERARVRRAVDPQGHPADHGHARRTQAPAQAPRDLDSLARRPAGANDRHRVRAIVQRAAHGPHEPPGRIAGRGHEEHGRGVREIAHAVGVGRIVPTDRLEIRALDRRAQVGRAQALDLLEDRVVRAAAETGDEPLGRQGQDLPERTAPAAGHVDGPGQPGDEPGPPQAGVARARHATSPSASSWSWR